MKKIYVAEDYLPNAEFIQDLLSENPDYAVSFFADGLQLYRRVQEEPPDLLVLDIILPSLTGLAVARLIRFHLDFRKIPILVVSSITDEDVKERARQCGADVFLRKPFQAAEFLREVQKLLG